MELFNHQVEALKATETLNRCAFYHDMGLGKTYTGAEKLMRLDADIALIVCQKSKVDDWVNHFVQNYCDCGDVFVYDLTKPKQLTAFLAHNKPEIMVVGVINYDLLFRRKELHNLEGFTLMLDESSMIQNEKAKRTKCILKLRAANVILLSGTPVGGKYENLWSQCKLLGWDIKKKDFWDRYITYRLYSPAPMIPPIKIVTGYKNVDDLKTQLARHGAHFLKTEDVLSLPDQVFSTIGVPTNPEYKRFMKDKVVEVEGETLVGDNPLKVLLYARQLCGAYSSAKVAAFKDWLESTDGRLIVFYSFTSELERLKKVVGDRPISVVNGEEKKLMAYEEYENSITFIQYQAGAMGLNLQKANHIAYYSLPLSSELFEQSKKRTHRIGQSKTCFYYFFIVKNSVEEQILETLKKRRDYTDALFLKDHK